MSDTLIASKQSVDEFYDRIIVIDGLGGDVSPGKVNQHTAGITAFNATVASPHTDFRQTVSGIYSHMTLLEGLPEKLVQVQKLEDVHRAKKEGKTGVIFGLQDGSGVEGDITLVTMLHKLEIRVMTLTYNERNALGDGCLEPHDAGITNLGMQVVREMNRLGIVLDLSHSSERTTLDAMKITTKPPVFSHSNPKALTPSPRCITDDQMKAARDLNGLVGISVYSPMTWSKPGVQPTLDDYLDRMEYAVGLVGVDHVAIGSDIFEGKGPIMWTATTKRRYPEMVGEFEHDALGAKGYESHAEIRNVAKGLDKRGYSHEDVEKIMGGNWMRILTANLT